jgi:ABC-type Fe3+ transport system permease subunit
MTRKEEVRTHVQGVLVGCFVSTFFGVIVWAAKSTSSGRWISNSYWTLLLPSLIAAFLAACIEVFVDTED